MNKYAYSVLAVSATLTVAITQTLGWSAFAKEKNRQATIAVKPVIKLNGVTITPTLNKKSFQKGETPSVTITVKNNSSKPTELNLILTNSVAAPPRNIASLSRTLSLPSEKSNTLRIAVKPGATKTYTIVAATAIPDTLAYSLRLQVGEKVVNLMGDAMLLRFSPRNLNPKQSRQNRKNVAPVVAK